MTGRVVWDCDCPPDPAGQREHTCGPLTRRFFYQDDGSPAPNPELKRRVAPPPAPPGCENPKLAAGAAKLPLHLVPEVAIAHESLAWLEGVLKYGHVNWRATDSVQSSTYIAACKRHLGAWFEGEDCDPATGVHHLAYARACLGLILDAQEHGCLTDDRPLSNSGHAEAMNRLAGVMVRVKEAFVDREPRHYTIKDTPPCPVGR